MIRNTKKNYIEIENFFGGNLIPNKEIVRKYNEILEITTKNFIYNILIKAYIVKQNDFDKKKYRYVKGR